MPFVLSLTRFRFGMTDRSVLDRNACYLPKVHEWIVLPDSERWQEVAAKRSDPIEPVTEAPSRWQAGPTQLDWDFFGVNVSEVPGADALRLESRTGSEAGLDRVADWFTRHCHGWVVASVRRDP